MATIYENALTAYDMYRLTLLGAASHMRKGITTAFNLIYAPRSRSGETDRAQFEVAIHSGFRFVHCFNVGRCSQSWPTDRALGRVRIFLT